MFAVILPYLHLFAADAATSCSKSFIGLKTWFAYFPNDWFGPITSGPGKQSAIGPCQINSNFSFLPSDGHSGLLLIGLAVLDDLIRIAALVAVGFVIYGGIQYATSQGSPDATNKARQTIINALVGLAIAIMATTIVSFVGSKLG